MDRCMLGLAVASLCASGCAVEEISGNLFARGGVLGEWALDPVVCLSGELDGFRGVDLHGDRGRMRLVLSSPDGPTIEVAEPHPVVPRRFSRAECERFRVTFERTPNYINDVRVVNGSIDIECTAEARAVFGHIAFEGCH